MRFSAAPPPSPPPASLQTLNPKPETLAPYAKLLLEDLEPCCRKAWASKPSSELATLVLELRLRMPKQKRQTLGFQKIWASPLTLTRLHKLGFRVLGIFRVYNPKP